MPTNLMRNLIAPMKTPGMGAGYLNANRNKRAITLDDGGPIATSFPIFEQLMGDLGADIRRE